MLSLIVVSAACSALVAAAMTFWLISRRRTLQVQQIDIVDSAGRVRGRLSTFDGKVVWLLATVPVARRWGCS